MVVYVDMDKTGEVTTKHEASQPVLIPAPTKVPQGITPQDTSPSSKHTSAHVLRFLEEESQHHKPAPSTSPHSAASDEDFHLPDGSPSFSTVMSELKIDLSQATVHSEAILPVSPLALSNGIDVFSSDPPSPEAKFPVDAQESPVTQKKRINSAASSSKQRIRSNSWNYRNRMAAERRKQLALSVPRNEPSSTHSSPMIARKTYKAKSQPTTPQLLRISPKYKFLTESISISHEDIVKAQERERHLDEGFSEVKSIFESPVCQGYGESP